MESGNISELLTAGELEIKMRKRDSYEINNSSIPRSPLATSPGRIHPGDVKNQHCVFEAC
jgi:hypothetical protein